MAILVIAEHDNKQLKPGFANTVAAAAKLADDIHALVVGSQCADAATAAAKIAGVKKVLVADAPHLEFEDRGQHELKGLPGPRRLLAHVER